VNVSSGAVGGITNYIPAGAIDTDQGLSNGSQASTSLTPRPISASPSSSRQRHHAGTRSRLRITC